MMKVAHGPTELLHALTWGAFDHTSHAPQVRACNYYVCIYLCFVYVCVLVCEIERE